MQPKNLKFPYKWEDRRPEIKEGVLFIPDFYQHHQECNFPAWEEIFGNDKPVMLEYCSGNGSWIVNKAKDKSVNWVAVEWRFERVQKIWSKKMNHQVENLFIVCGDAQILIREYLKKGSVDGVYVNFPDPWPKDKHAKNRLFQPLFMQEMSRTVKAGAPLTIVTDDLAYSEQLKEVIFANGGWMSNFEPPYYVTNWEGYGPSYFDSLWREKGREIRYFYFTRRED